MHGYSLDTTSWFRCWNTFPGYFHVGVDLPYHGRSHGFDEYPDISAFAADLAVLARDENFEYIVALSFGTILALEVLVWLPAQFRTVILASASLPNSPPDAIVRSIYMQLMQLQLSGASRDEITAAWLGQNNPIFASMQGLPTLKEEIETILSRHCWDELKDGYMFRFQQGSRIPDGTMKVAARVIVVRGENDTNNFRRQAEAVASKIPGSELADVLGAGHLCLLEQPHCVETYLYSNTQAVVI